MFLTHTIINDDLSFQIGSEAKCTKPICCRNYAGQTGSAVESAEKFGNKNCDTPIVLGDSMLDAIKSIAPTAKFSILTGDVVDRAFKNLCLSSNLYLYHFKQTPSGSLVKGMSEKIRTRPIDLAPKTASRRMTFMRGMLRWRLRLELPFMAPLVSLNSHL